jgi:hypothetical protein
MKKSTENGREQEPKPFLKDFSDESRCKMKSITENGPYMQDCRCGMIALFLMLPILARNGFSVEKAVADYQANHAQHFRCPYAGKTGSCSQLLLEQGPVVVIRKCKALRDAQE